MFLGARGAGRHIVNLVNEAEDHRVRMELKVTNIADLHELHPGHKYHWRVDAIWSDGAVRKGDLWTFTVEEQTENVDGSCTGDMDGCKRNDIP